MARITINDGFRVFDPTAIDERFVVDDRTTVDPYVLYEGLIVYDTMDNGVYVYNTPPIPSGMTQPVNSADGWEEVGSGGLSTVESNDSLSGDGSTDNPLGVVAIADEADNTRLIKMWTGTTAEYNDLSSIDDDTLYNITDDFDEIQTSQAAVLTSISFNTGATEFNQNGATVTFTVAGGPGVRFDLSLDMVEPSGWLTSGALSLTSGTIGHEGTSEGTITFPETEMTVNRTARIVATNSGDTENVVTTGLFRQILGHGTQGDLTASFEVDIVGTTISSSSTIISGDHPFTLELYDTDPSATPTPAPLQTITTASSREASRTNPLVVPFEDLDSTTYDTGDRTFYLMITDSGTGDDEDVLIESETIEIISTDALFTGVDDLHYGGGTETLNLMFMMQQEGTYSASYSHGNDVQLIESTPRRNVDRYYRLGLPFTSSDTGNGSVIVTRTDVSPNIEVASLDYTRSTFENVFGGFYPVPSSNSVGIIRVPTLRTASGQTSSSGTFRVYSDESLTNQVRSANITVNYEAGGRTSTGFSPDPFNISGLSPETQYWITFESASVGGGASTAGVPFTTTSS